MSAAPLVPGMGRVGGASPTGRAQSQPEMQELPRKTPGQQQLERDAASWRSLMDLAGSWQDGSDQTITLMQDEATRECIVKLHRALGGYVYHCAGTFAAAVTKAGTP